MTRRLSWDKKNLEPLRPGLSVGVSGLVTNEFCKETKPSTNVPSRDVHSLTMYCMSS